MKQLIYLIIAIVFANCSNKKEQLTLLTTSKTISIKDGNEFYKDIWTISPEVKLDEFVTRKFTGDKKVSFISDIDTITIDVRPDNTYDFVIQYYKQNAFTRVNTDNLKEASIARMKVLNYSYKDKRKSAKRDTIPFTIGNDNRIYLKGKINGSDTINLLFDTGANAHAITSSVLGNKVKMIMDGETLNHGSDGISIKQSSSKNTLEIGNLQWNNVKFSSIGYKKQSFDAVIGWVAFGNKTVEIDYENNIIVLHPSFKNIPKGYSKVETSMIKGIPYIKGFITISNQEHSGWFEYDTGGTRSFYLSKEYTTKNKLDYKNMKLIGKTGAPGQGGGSKGVSFKRNIYRLPKLKFGEFETYLIPIAIAEKDPEGIEFNDILGNNLLKRFNAIIDFKKYQIYLKPNTLLHSRY